MGVYTSRSNAGVEVMDGLTGLLASLLVTDSLYLFGLATGITNISGRRHAL